MFRCVVALVLLAGAHLAGAATPKSNAHAATPVGPVGIVTILEGKVAVIRALSQFEAAQGMRLLANDLLRTQPNSLLRVEYADECWLELGPDTLLQLSHPAEKKRGNRPGLYLLQGWLKLGCKANSGADGALASGDVDVVGLSGAIVVRASGESHAIFAEQGSARVIRRRTREAAPIALNRGDFLFVVPDRAPAVQARPTADFIDALPRAYRDTLPSRYSMFVSRAVDPKEQRTFSYADVEPWLNAEAAIRRQFVGLWSSKVHDPAFRGPLDRDLAMHPEWDRILHPEKYEEPVGVPTRPPSVTAKPAAVPQGQSAEKSVPQSN
ncbi:MAG: hypothetical protein ACJ8R9_09255 [Steroidobacteraceae bacterium]